MVPALVLVIIRDHSLHSWRDFVHCNQGFLAEGNKRARRAIYDYRHNLRRGNGIQRDYASGSYCLPIRADWIDYWRLFLFEEGGWRHFRKIDGAAATAWRIPGVLT